ncbi:MAG: hypothetical protein QOK20_2517, partial [Acidimicrobiaceae bacterium]|nr:hypothetical protein [Acidimicrobiaceae bacterium]
EVVTALRVSVGVNVVNGVNGVGPESVAVHDFHALGPNP